MAGWGNQKQGRQAAPRRRWSGGVIVHVARRPVPRTLRACAPFGLILARGRRRDDAGVRDGRAACATALVRHLAPGGCALVTGPSGAGKSFLLREVAHRVRRAGGVVIRPRQPTGRMSVVERVPGALPVALRRLAAAGLAEAMVFARAVDELSEGQRWRLSVALALARADAAPAGRAVWLLVDELASTLDRTTARGVCGTLTRLIARGRRVRLLAATAHEDVGGLARWDAVVEHPLLAPPQLRWCA